MNFLSDEEKNEQLLAFNETKFDYQIKDTILDFFEAQVTSGPELIAIRTAESELTYKELDDLSNQLAHCLIDNYGVQPNDLVGIKLDNSEWAIISLLSVLKAGATYVPIDPKYPAPRKQYILAESEINVLITDTNYLFDEEEFDGTVFAIDVEFEKDEFNTDRINQIGSSSDLAYVLFTSGSTGKPKGVMISHKSLANYLSWSVQAYAVDSGKLDFGLFTSLSFDLTVTSIYLPLISGGAIRVFDSSLDTVSLLTSYFQSELNAIKLTPAHVGLLSNMQLEQTKIQVAIVGGDTLTSTHIETLRTLNPAIKIYNEYGPTEATVGCIVKEIKSEKEANLIGKPIGNTQVYLLSGRNDLQPLGVTGEICISGYGLAAGYLKREDLTAEKFIENPFVAGERLYKTGDLGKWHPDGNIAFVGRKDNQVKIKGYRIELGEVEHALSNHEEVKQVIVIAKENEQEREIIAYITGGNEQNAADLRAYLTKILPAYMLPVHFVQLDEFPLTPNGKIDKKSLPDPKGLTLSGGVEFVAPNSVEEKVLASVWSDVLKRENISIKDSFYNLGGDSIKSIQVVARLKQHGYSLKVEHILKTPELEQLCQFLKQTVQVADQREVKGEVALTPIQNWFLEDSKVTAYHYFNQSVLLKSNERIDSNLLEKSLADIVRHHDALRMIYKKETGAWKQTNLDSQTKGYSLDFYDLSESEDASQQIEELATKLQVSFSLEDGPLFKVVHFRLKDSDRLGLIIHHLVVDGVSWRILLEDLSNIYASNLTGKKPNLPLKTDSFQSWALAQNEYASSNELLKERSYWEQIGELEIAKFPQDFKVNVTESTVINAVESFTLNKATTELLQTSVHGAYNTDVNDLLVTSLGLAMEAVFSVDKVVLMMEGHGREDIIDGIDITRTVGWFTTMYPFLLKVSKALNEIDNLIGIKDDLRSVPNKGIGYGILNYLNEEGFQKEITPEIQFNYLGDFGANASDNEEVLFDFASESMGPDSAKENGNVAILDIAGMLVNGELNLFIRYSKVRYKEETIKKFAASFEKNLQVLIETLAQEKRTHLTPSDLTFNSLTRDELTKLNATDNVEDVYEFSPLQEGIYYHWLSEKSNSLYLEQTSYRVKAKKLEIEKLKRAYDRLTKRHGVLRTYFTNDYAGKSLQIVQKEVPSNFTYEKCENVAQIESFLEAAKRKDQDKGFDLGTGSQMRLHIIDLSGDEYEFIWSHHHILMDGWCVSVLINDFNELLSQETIGSTLDLSPTIPYSNYINWLNKIDKESSLDYWKNQLADYSDVAEIPFQLKTETKEFIEAKETLEIRAGLFDQLDALCNTIGITHNTFIQGVWGYLLSRYNNTNDVVFGAVVSGRPAELSGVEEMIGLFSNTIPVRVKYKPSQSAVDLLKTIHEQSIQSTAHHYMNLAEVQSQSELGMNLISHIMMYQNYVLKELKNEGVLNAAIEDGLTIESIKSNVESNYDFNIIISPLSKGLDISIKYNSSRYDSKSLKQLIIHFNNLINEFATNANQPLTTFNYLTTQETEEQLLTFNNTEVSYPKDRTIVDLFQEQAIKQPNNIALVYQDLELTYKELDDLSNQLAHCLKEEYAVGAEDLVGIQLERSEWMVISILAVLKAGGAYVPIDPEYPASRKEYIINDSDIKLLITGANFIYDIDYYDGNIFAIDVEFEAENYKKDKLSNSISVNNLAYVIYTSGSTGKPKGVLIEHKAIVNTILAQIDGFEIDNNSTGLQFASFSFDASVSETFIILLAGGKLAIVNEEARKDPQALIDFINGQGVDIATLPPSYLSEIDFNQIKGLKKLITAGEAANYEKAIAFLAHGTYYNAYGPAETSICGTIFKFEKQGDELWNNLPIGKPISNATVYILSEDGQVQAKGVIGEICIGGAGLAKGYLNQEALTKIKFIENPVVAGERLYKTGDLGRWLPDGNLEFIGRKDDQVKIRGYRIELGEIEHVLSQYAAIESVMVLAKKNENKEYELIAYLTAKGTENATNKKLNTNVLRTYLKAALPVYMLPAHFVELKEFPLTPNGKVDKKALPNPTGLGLETGVEYVTPKTKQEKTLVKVWTDVLKRDEIGIKDSFYNLGGDSIKSIQVIARLKQEGYTLKVEHILRTPVIEELAKLMLETTQVVDQVEVKGKVELTPIQKWFFETDEITVKQHFNQSMLLKSEAPIDQKILEKCLLDLTEHHDALRMIYKQEDGVWQQVNQGTNANNYTIDFYDLSQADNAEEELLQIGGELQASIDLGTGPLVKVVQFRLKDGDRLGLIMHHLVVDGVSWRILLEDLSSLYNNYKAGLKPILTLKTDSFQKWAATIKQYADSDKLQHERAYWEKVNSQEIASLPQDKQVTGSLGTINRAESFKLSTAATELLQTQVHHAYKTEVNDILLTSLGLAIKEVFAVDKTVFKMEGHGREDLFEGIDINRTVGWFTSVYPFVLDVSQSADELLNLIQVKEDLRSVPNKGVGYGIIKELSNYNLTNTLNSEVVFNYLGDFGANASGDDLFEYATEDLGPDVSIKNQNDATLDVSGFLVKGQLDLSIRYSEDRFNEATIQKLTTAYEKYLQSLIASLSKIQTTQITPSDLSFKGLQMEEVSKLNKDNNLADVYELSPLQEGMYFHWLADDSSWLYFEQTSYRVKAKEFDIHKLERAYAALVERHAVLRTYFSKDFSGRPLQIVTKNVINNFSSQQIKNSANPEKEITKIREEDKSKGFDLSNGSQMRVHVVDLSDGNYEFIWSHHHILMDGWCISVLINDFNELLKAELTGVKLDLAPAKPYADYINWLSKIDKENTLNYWSEYLSDYTEIAEVPFKSTTKKEGYLEAKNTIQIEGDLFQQVDELCAEIGITQNTLIQGVWGYLLSRYNNSNDVVFGAVVSGRPAELQGVEEMIGLFINTIPVRVKLEDKDSIRQFLESLQEASIQSASHHYVSLAEVQATSDLGMDLINHIMLFENYAVKEMTGDSVVNTDSNIGISIESVEVFEQTNYGFNIIVNPGEKHLNITVVYNENTYERLAINQLMEHFHNLILSFVQQKEQALKTLNYLSEDEKDDLLLKFNDTDISYPKEKTIIELFEKQVKENPADKAIVFEDKELTYQELDEVSNQLANYLTGKYDIKPDDVVGIQLERSEWMLISMLGILKSGGAYVPIDHEHPDERVAVILEDSKSKALLNKDELVMFKNVRDELPSEQLTTKTRANNLAYIIYTSGSTGKPKGVMIAHQNVTNFFTGMNSIFGQEKGTFLSMTNYTFDISVLELLWTLTKGYKVVIQGEAKQIETIDNDYSVYGQIKKHKVTHLQITPSMGGILNQYLKEDDQWDSLKYILLGGEPATAKLVNRIYENLPNVKIYNMYGPTETTIWSTVKALEMGVRKVEIGHPIANTKIYILDANQNLVPTGVQGEIHIGGSGVARGYTNAELSRQNFIENPYHKGERLYRTGDFGAWLKSGSLYCFGRKDQQVKIHGHRIELGEIEQALLKDERINEAVVLINENQEKLLIAYLISNQELNTNELRSLLKKYLPTYMIPNHFVQLEEFPLNSSGKLDKKAFPNPLGIELSSGIEYVPPKNEIEEKLINLWQELLDIDKIGTSDDFFVLGGHSLKATQLIIRIDEVFSVKIYLRNFLENPTIKNLAEEISTLEWMNNKRKETNVEGDEIII